MSLCRASSQGWLDINGSGWGNQLRRYLIALAVLASLAAGGVLGADYYIQKDVERQVDAFLESLPFIASVARGPVRYSIRRNEIEIDNILIRFPDVKDGTLLIAKASLSDLQIHGEEGLSVAALHMMGLEAQGRNFSVTFGAYTFPWISRFRIKIPELRGTNIKIRLEPFETLFYTVLKKPDVSIYQAYSFALDTLAESFSVGELHVKNYQFDTDLVMLEAVYEPKTPLHYDMRADEVVVRDWNSGLIAEQSTKGWSGGAKIGGAEGLEVEISGDNLEILGLDLKNAGRIYRGPIGAGDHIHRRVADMIVADKISYEVKGLEPGLAVRATINGILISDYKLRPLPAALLTARFETMSPEQKGEFLHQAMDIYRLGRVLIVGVSLRDETDYQLFGLASIELEDYAGTSLKGLTIEGLISDIAGQGSLELASFTIAGLDYGRLLEALPRIAMRQSLPLGSFPRLERLALSDLKMNMGGQGLFLDKLVLESRDYFMSLPTQGIQEISGLKIPLLLIEDETTSRAARLMGLKSLEISARSSYSWDLGSGKMVFEVFEFQLKDLASLRLSLSFVGLSTGFVMALHGDEAALSDGSLNAVRFQDAALTYRDSSLLPRAFEAASQTLGQPEIKLRDEVLAEIRPYFGILRDPELIAKAFSATTTFLEDPQSLSVKLAPDDPIPYGLAQRLLASDPSELAKALNITIEANRPQTDD